MRMINLFKTNGKHQLLALFTICVAVVIFTEVLVYQKLNFETFKQNVDLAKIDHEKAYNEIEQLDKEAGTIYNRLLMDESLTNVLQSSSEHIDYYGLGELQKSFLKIIHTNGDVVSVYLHTKKNDMVLSTNFIMSNLDLFNNVVFFRKLYEQQRSYKWLSARHEVAHNMASPSVLPFVTYIPQYAQSSAIVLNFKVPGALERLHGDRGIIVLNQEDELVMNKNSELISVFEKHKDEILSPNTSGIIRQFDGYYFFVSAQKGAFKLISIVPGKEINGGSRLNYLLAALILSVMLIFFLFNFIKKLFFKSQEAYQHNLRENQEDLKHHFLYKILLNTNTKKEEIESKAKEIGIDLSSDCFRVVVFHIDDFYNYLLNMENDDRYLKNKIVFNAIKWVFLLEHNAHVVKTDLEKIAVLIPHEWGASGEKEYESIQKTILYVQKEIKDTCNLTVCVGVSETVDSFEQIPLCHAHALKAVEYKAIFGKDRIIRYEEIDRHQISFQHYPFVEINKINGYIREGNIVKIKEKMDKLYQDYMSDSSCSMELINSIMTNLLYGIVKLLFEFRYRLEDVFKEDIFITMYSQEVFKDKMKYIFKLYSHMIEYRKNKEESSTTKKIQLVINYIHTNYDKDISLTSIADELRMNSTYLSTLIKSELGFGFLDYVNELRVKKSIELLKHKELTIQNIALACGYITVHSYIRNFKKYYLVTPNDFRNKLYDQQGHGIQ